MGAIDLYSRSRGQQVARVATRLLLETSAAWPGVRKVRLRAVRKALNTPDIHVAGRVHLETSHLRDGSALVIGDAVEIAADVLLDISGKLTIGSGVTISERAMIFTHNHGHRRKDLHWREQGLTYYDLEIADGAWIGANATILGSCKKIGEGAIVAAGAIVTKEVEPYSVVGGNPARVISTRT